MKQQKPIYKIFVFIIALLLMAGFQLQAKIWEVRPDGSGDFTDISPAVAAAENRDTILVWPGTYLENIFFEDKSLMLASLALTTGIDSYRDSTLIDGNGQSSCIAMANSLDTSHIIGFSLTNGAGSDYIEGYQDGGGIFARQSQLKISNCHLFNNEAKLGSGGGIYIRIGSLSVSNSIIENNSALQGGGGGISANWLDLFNLSGTSIRNNYASNGGGGVAIYQSEVQFDTINRCNIYLNKASVGMEISGNTDIPLNIVLDTFTIDIPSQYFARYIDDNGNPYDTYGFDVRHAKITPVDSDLYVNPILGSDSNSGLDAAHALRTIAMANILIAEDSLQPHTIHLADGVYADSTNGEYFPLGIRPWVTIEGQSMESTILDGQYKNFLFRGNNNTPAYTLRRMTMQRGGNKTYDWWRQSFVAFVNSYWYNHGATLDSIVFQNGWSDARLGVFVSRSEGAQVKNCVFKNHVGGHALSISLSEGQNYTYVHSCKFLGNQPDTAHPEGQIQGGGLDLGNQYGKIIVTNSLFDGNETLGSMAFFSSNAHFANCTFVNNGNNYGIKTALLVWASQVNAYNCLFYQNGPPSIKLVQYDDVPAYLSITNSLIENGEEGIVANTNTSYDYDESNISGDPLFLGLEPYPYNLSMESPCIDAGTLELPDFIELPETDLAGNPRIVNGKIDMGAYEWNPTVGIQEMLPLKNPIDIFPNPTNQSVTIDSPQVETIWVFNLKGELIKTISGGNSVDLSELPSGTYLIKTKSDNSIFSNKVIKY